MFRVPDLGIILRTAFVMPDAAQMTHHLARRDRPWLLRKGRAIFLHGRIEIELVPARIVPSRP